MDFTWKELACELTTIHKVPIIFCNTEVVQEENTTVTKPLFYIYNLAYQGRPLLDGTTDEEVGSNEQNIINNRTAHDTDIQLQLHKEEIEKAISAIESKSGLWKMGGREMFIFHYDLGLMAGMGMDILPIVRRYFPEIEPSHLPREEITPSASSPTSESIEMELNCQKNIDAFCDDCKWLPGKCDEHLTSSDDRLNNPEQNQLLVQMPLAAPQHQTSFMDWNVGLTADVPPTEIIPAEVLESRYVQMMLRPDPPCRCSAERCRAARLENPQQAQNPLDTTDDSPSSSDCQMSSDEELEPSPRLQVQQVQQRRSSQHLQRQLRQSRPRTTIGTARSFQPEEVPSRMVNAVQRQPVPAALDSHPRTNEIERAVRVSSEDEEGEDQRQHADQTAGNAITLPPQSNKIEKALPNSGLRIGHPKRLTATDCTPNETKNEISLCRKIIDTKLNNFFLTDHSYYQNRPHNLECLGIQTPSESEEEIDVVNDNPYLLRDIEATPTANLSEWLAAQAAAPTAAPAAAPASSSRGRAARPRGRPPSNRQGRKRPAQSPERNQPPARRPCQQRRRGAVSRGRGSSRNAVSQQERRNLHNNMESRRRHFLKMRFEDLRKLVPATASNERAPKVMILTEATHYCSTLTAQARDSVRQLDQRQVQLNQKRAALEVLKRRYDHMMKVRD